MSDPSPTVPPAGSPQSEPTHTATPWNLSNGTVLGADGVGVCRAFERFDNAGPANSRHIVKCVNSHDDLLAACKIQDEWLDLQSTPQVICKFGPLVIAFYKKHGIPPEVPAADFIRDFRRAAIAKAGGVA